MFAVDDKVIYPGHGVAKIKEILKKTVGGTNVEFYELLLFKQDVTILVPVANIKSIGIRPLSTQDNVKDAFKFLAKPAKRLKNTDAMQPNWNKRCKDYQERLRTGNLQEICGIYRDLQGIAGYKELSFGEKNLLQQTEELLAEEIAVIEGVQIESIAAKIRESVEHMLS
jgi:CarD family transcriptional regulator